MHRGEPEISASYLEGLDSLLQTAHPSSGLSVARLLDLVGVAAPTPEHPLERISLNRYADILELAAQRTGDECFGLHFAQALPVGVSGIFGFLVMNAPDLKSMAACLARYSRIHCDSFDLSFEESDGEAQITWRLGPDVTAPHKQFLEFLLALFVCRTRLLTGAPWTPRRVAFAYREPNCAGEYEHLFGTSLTFDAPVCRMTGPAASFRARGVNSNSLLFKALKEAADKELAAIPTSNSLQERLEAHIIRHIAVDGVKLESAAAALGLSARQLQAQLRREGARYEGVLGDVRRRLAERYLRDMDLPMTEIALMLGFSELSAFTRAARGWFGCAPTEMRARLRREVHGD